MCAATPFGAGPHVTETRAVELNALSATRAIIK